MTKLSNIYAANIQPIDLPIGYDDFGNVLENNLNVVDKSLFIKDLIDDKKVKVTVITRPRRFGKTLNLSMLHYFFAKFVRGKPTKHLFKNFNITKAGKIYMDHQGKYPVIFVTLKGIHEADFNLTYKAFCKLIADTYEEHSYLLTSPKLAAHQKKIFTSILEEKAEKATIKTALKDLSKYLYRHYGIKPWLLIDEYDTPIQSAYLNDYYDEKW